ncbi:MAG: FtsX-like permease family protein [Muribaculaceae bacterium]|nr:FtsX-like permease family protein [Roseburia sp.]MCM1432260.1 FtsX-like permease family protein [Muribaculaceae bacterium]MCM1494001.1 FtsX-like permease family protein [Muribaculaceae bacterium]MCM1561062.1 FtsX-like permease family protein [Butyrivibrio sp.]
MRKIKNKSIIRKIAWAKLRGGGKKNAVILLAVTLTTFMFTTLFSVIMSMNATMEQSTMRQVGGSSMAGFKCMLPEDYETVKNDAETRNVSYRIIVGDAVSPELGEIKTEAYYAMEENAENMFCAPTTGAMPKEKMEAATSTIVLDKLGVPHRLGEKFTLLLRVGQEVQTYEFTLCGFWKGDSVAMSQMCFLSREFCDEVAFTPEVPSWENVDMYTGYWMIDFNFKSSFDIEGQVEKLMERTGFDERYVNYGINWAYSTSYVDMATVQMYLVILALILLAGYLIIYNIFYIQVVTDIHSYGLLKTIGTTGRQLKKLVRAQALCYCVTGIPAGLLLGTIGGRVLFPAVAGSTTASESSYSFSISPFIYIFAAVFSLITVFLSCEKPCKTAARVSPVEAVSYNEVVGKKRKKKARKVTPLTLAVSGLSRNKKKLCIVVLSLSLSLLVANGVYTMVGSFDADKYISNMIVGDLSIQDVSVNNFSSMVNNFSGVSGADREYFDSLEGARQSNVYYMAAAVPFNERMEEFMEQSAAAAEGGFNEGIITWMMEERMCDADVYGVDDFALNSMHVYDGKIDAEKFMQGGYAIVSGYELMNLGPEEQTDFYEPGDTVELELSDGTKLSYEVMAVAELPYALTKKSYSMMAEVVCIPSEDFLAHNEEDKGALYSVLTVEEDKLAEVEAAVRQYVENSQSLSLVSKETYMKEFEEFSDMICLVGGALSVVLALIGILNFINAIVTAMLARQRELAMMEAVGMTVRQLNAMLIWEGVCYAAATTVFAVLANFLVGNVLLQAVVGEVWFFTYHFTVVPILLCLPLLLLLTVVIPYMASRSMRKNSVVERMKFE